MISSDYRRGNEGGSAVVGVAEGGVEGAPRSRKSVGEHRLRDKDRGTFGYVFVTSVMQENPTLCVEQKHIKVSWGEGAPIFVS